MNSIYIINSDGQAEEANYNELVWQSYVLIIA